MILRSLDSEEGIRVNRQFEELLGLTAEGLAENPLAYWVHPDDLDSLARPHSDGVGHIKARHRDAEGEWFEFSWSVRSFGGNAVALGLADTGEKPITPDGSVTDAVPANSLKATLSEMASIVESKNEGMRCSILLLDKEQEYVTVGAGPRLPQEYNDAIEGLLIGPRVGSCGTAAFWNLPIVVEDIFTDTLWTELREAAKIAGVAACWSQPITATTGEVLGAMALYSDSPCAPADYQMDGLEIAARMVGLAVERDRLEEQLRRSAKLEALGVLAGGIAHDFNNLLVAILGNAELAKLSIDDENPAGPMLGDIVKASLGATELCSQMLAYAGRGAATPELLDCNDVIRELGSLLKVSLSKKAILVFELSDERAGVSADSSQLRQIIMNLITNASEAVGDHEGVIVISTSICEFTREELEQRHPQAELQAGSYVLLTVRDTGEGMDSATKEALFDPFFTTKATGRGLGLAAVQGIVRRHQGGIDVESERGIGTTFSVLLPHAVLPPEAHVLVPEKEHVKQEKTILVVDDEPQVREVIANQLRRAGYETLVASDGLEAIELFKRAGDSIDCVLLDLSMPKLDGGEVFHELRRIRKDVRVILSSGYAEEQILDRFEGQGLAGVVQKPAKMNSLLAKISEAITC